MYLLLGVTFIFSGCKGSSKSDYSVSQYAHDESFHADNDIAMTIRSLADAIKVGEPLDSVEYDFRGVLTDGQGTPLYTDIDGIPGIWDVDVLDNGRVSIRNLYLGDLLAHDLELYILESLKLTADNRMPGLNDTVTDRTKNFVSVYPLSGGYMKYEVVNDTASNGMEGSLVTITLGVNPSIPDETQTAA